MKKGKQIGIAVKLPSKDCKDKKCPFHGSLKLRGRTFTGKVVSKDTHRTAKVQWPRQTLIKKYERFEKKESKVKVHNPSCIDATIGDTVKIVESKPISKTKNFVIIEVIKK